MIDIATVTPNTGLHVFSADDTDITVLDWRTKVAGDDPNSNMTIIDGAIKDLRDNKAALVNGKVPANELPSYVDDVLEFAQYSQLPSPGEQGKIYVVFGDTTELNGQYRWTGTVYSSISNQIDFATKEEAEAGENNSKAMTALRSMELVASLKDKPNGVVGTGADKKILPVHLPTNLLTYGDGQIATTVQNNADTLGGKTLGEIEADAQAKADAAKAGAIATESEARKQAILVEATARAAADTELLPLNGSRVMTGDLQLDSNNKLIFSQLGRDYMPYMIGDGPWIHEYAERIVMYQQNAGMSGVNIEGLPLVPDGNTCATSKAYVDEKVAGMVPSTGLPISKGGTGATTQAAARTALGAAPLASPVFTGTPKAPASSTSYTTYQIRNAALLTSAPSSLSNGAIAFIYS